MCEMLLWLCSGDIFGPFVEQKQVLLIVLPFHLGYHSFCYRAATGERKKKVLLGEKNPGLSIVHCWNDTRHFTTGVSGLSRSVPLSLFYFLQSAFSLGPYSERRLG